MTVRPKSLGEWYTPVLIWRRVTVTEASRIPVGLPDFKSGVRL